jgi:hypothetical protein
MCVIEVSFQVSSLHNYKDSNLIPLKTAGNLLRLFQTYISFSQNPGHDGGIDVAAAQDDANPALGTDCAG